MAVEIPKEIQREVSLIKRGKKLKKRVKKEPNYSIEELFSTAVKKLEFLNEVANTEPIFSFLNDSGRTIMVLDQFNTRFPQDRLQDNIGRLVLRKIGDKVALYEWIDADYPANRSDRDYRLITKEMLGRWHSRSLRRFALLTEREIWKNIKEWLRVMRRL